MSAKCSQSTSVLIDYGVDVKGTKRKKYFITVNSLLAVISTYLFLYAISSMIVDSTFDMGFNIVAIAIMLLIEGYLLYDTIKKRYLSNVEVILLSRDKWILAGKIIDFKSTSVLLNNHGCEKEFTFDSSLISSIKFWNGKLYLLGEEYGISGSLTLYSKEESDAIFSLFRSLYDED